MQCVCRLKLRSTIKTSGLQKLLWAAFFTLHWPRYPPGTAPMPFCEWDRPPYGRRQWTSCTTLGDMCPGDCPILTPPGLWQLCSLCAEAQRSPSGCYFWVHTRRKITVKRILWLAYLLFNSWNSFPKGTVIFFIHTGRNDKLEHILTISLCELPLLF